MYPKLTLVPCVVFHIETSHLFCRAKQMTGSYMKRNTGLKLVKVVSTTFVLVYFLSINKSTCQTGKNVFFFHFKSSFRSRENQILEFYIFKFHDVIKCLSIKQEIHFTG